MGKITNRLMALCCFIPRKNTEENMDIQLADKVVAQVESLAEEVKKIALERDTALVQLAAAIEDRKIANAEVVNLKASLVEAVDAAVKKAVDGSVESMSSLTLERDAARAEIERLKKADEQATTMITEVLAKVAPHIVKAEGDEF